MHVRNEQQINTTTDWLPARINPSRRTHLRTEVLVTLHYSVRCDIALY